MVCVYESERFFFSMMLKSVCFISDIGIAWDCKLSETKHIKVHWNNVSLINILLQSCLTVDIFNKTTGLLFISHLLSLNKLLRSTRGHVCLEKRRVCCKKHVQNTLSPTFSPFSKFIRRKKHTFLSISTIQIAQAKIIIAFNYGFNEGDKKNL